MLGGKNLDAGGEPRDGAEFSLNGFEDTIYVLRIDNLEWCRVRQVNTPDSIPMLRSEFCVAVMKNNHFVNEYETKAFKPVGESLLIFGGMDHNYQLQS